MSRSVTWNGITQFRPGGITKINANALAQIGLSTNGIIGLIGEADGGTAEPGTVVTIDDPALAAEYFKSGALANAVGPAFDPSVDPRIPGGAFRVLGIRTNSATQAALTLYGRTWTGTADTGSTVTVIQVAGSPNFTVDALAGNILRFNAEDRVIDSNTVDTITVATAFSGAPVSGDTLEILTPDMVLTAKVYGVEGNQTQFEWEPGVSFGGAWTTARGASSQSGEDVGDQSFLQVEYIGQASTVVQYSGTATGGTATTIVETGAGWAINQFQDMFAEVTLGGVRNLRKVVSNTADTLTVVTLTGAPTTETFRVLTGMVLTGTATAGAASTITLEATNDVGTGELDGLIVAIVGGTGAGQRRVIASHTAGASPVLTVSQAWTTTPDATSVYELRYATQATGSFVGASGVASSFQTTIAVDGGVAATDLNIPITTQDTVEDLASTINADPNYSATIPSGVNRQTTLASTFDFDLGNTDVDLRNDKDTITTQPTPTLAYTVPWPNNFKRNIAVLVADINDKNEFVTAERATSGGAGTGGGRPEWTGTGSVGTLGDSIAYLTGAVRGTSDNTAFQNAFDTLLQTRHNFVVPLIVQDLANEGLGSTATWASVAAQLSAHVDAANGIAKNECGGLIGYSGTRDALISAGNNLNSADIQISGQQLQLLDVDGSLKLMDEWSMSVVAAGMRAGAPEVGEPITHKFIKTYDLQQDTSWDPRDRTDANLLIANGILFAEFIQGKGYRFVRDLTTHVQDDNLAYSEGSVRDVVRYIAYGLRTYLEDRYTGVKGTPANATGIKNDATAYLEAANSENIIVTSLNADNVVVPGFESIRVTISGDIATVKVQIYPAVGINFQLNDIYLQLPRQAA